MYEIFEKLCEQMGITPYRFCKDTGISTSTISTWKNKGSKCGAKLQKAVCDYFGVTADYLRYNITPYFKKSCHESCHEDDT